MKRRLFSKSLLTLPALSTFPAFDLLPKTVDVRKDPNRIVDFYDMPVGTKFLTNYGTLTKTYQDKKSFKVVADNFIGYTQNGQPVSGLAKKCTKEFRYIPKRCSNSHPNKWIPNCNGWWFYLISYEYASKEDYYNDNINWVEI